MQEGESETGAAWAPGIRSGPVFRFAGRAHGLDGQAHQVVVPLQPDVQPRAVAHAQELAAFKAAPLGGRNNGTLERRGRVEATRAERIGHERLLYVIEETCMADRISDRRPQKVGPASDLLCPLSGGLQTPEPALRILEVYANH